MQLFIYETVFEKNMFKVIRKFCVLFTLGIITSDSFAANFIPDGYCAAIAASRQNPVEITDFLNEFPPNSTPEVFLAKNGWFAISYGLLRVSESKTRLSSWKSLGYIPQDAICSRGANYKLRFPLNRTKSGYAFDKIALENFLVSPVNPEFFNKEEITAIQLALALNGHYEGLLDGDWGKITANALANYTQTTFSDEARYIYLAPLVAQLSEQLDNDGWVSRTFAKEKLSVILPLKHLDYTSGNNHHLWMSPDETLMVAIETQSRNEMQQEHLEIKQEIRPSSTYATSTAHLRVTSGSFFGGGRIYFRSDRRGSYWVSTTIIANEKNARKLGTIASSIKSGADLDQSIKLDRLLLSIFSFADSIIEKNNDIETEKAQLPSDRTVESEINPSSGSGFFINEKGTFLTNHHVVDGCRQLSIEGAPFQVGKHSEELDLALLEPENPMEVLEFAKFSAIPAKLNSDVTTAGFPYRGLFKGINITRGAVSSLSGIGGSPFELQFTAPVQAGNSGGPLLNQKAHIVGVVVAKLDARQVEKNLDDTPQNINFAVKGSTAKLFLDTMGADYHVADTSEQPLTPEAIADQAIKFTYQVSCN